MEKNIFKNGNVQNVEKFKIATIAKLVISHVWILLNIMNKYRLWSNINNK